jgi:extracellular factor (EF) 3-hydroxypalmitic acid methyl ester biosynthesis protein
MHREPLDHLHRRLVGTGLAESGLAKVFEYLRVRRQAMMPSDWLRWVEEVALRHRLRDVLHSDPFTARVFARPRGYPGDPTTLDLLYGSLVPELRHVHPAPSFHSHPVHRFVTGRPAGRAIADRCRTFAGEIDRAAAEKPGCRVLCLAAGRLREARLSLSLVAGGVGELVALDFDPDVVRETAAATRDLPVRCQQAAVRDLLSWRLLLGSFDLVYTASLLDHLTDRPAALLLDCLVQHLRPGGRVVVANFLPDHPDRGYMESFMAWRMVCRDPDALSRLAAPTLSGCHTASARVDAHGTVGYLEIARSA